MRQHRHRLGRTDLLCETLVAWQRVVPGGGNDRTELRQRCSGDGYDSQRHARNFPIAAANDGAGCRGDTGLVSAGIVPRSNRTNDRRSEWTCHRASPQ